MKKFIIISVLSCLFSASFYGCAKNTVEINERLIIQAIGIDSSENEYEVTVQYLDSVAPGTGENSTGGNGLTKCSVFTGKTVSEALSGVEEQTGFFPLYSQMHVVLIGNSAAKTDIRNVLDFFIREYSARSNVLLAVAKNNAKDIISADMGPNIIVGKAIENALLRSNDSPVSAAVPLYAFFSRFLSEDDCAYCPVIDVTTDEFDDNKSVVIPAGTAIFNADGSFFITEKLTAASLPLITGKDIESKITVQTEDGSFTMKITKNLVKIKPKKTDTDGFSVSVSQDIKCDISEFCTTDGTQLSAEKIKKAAEKTAAELCSTERDLLYSTLYERGADICRFFPRIRLKYPQLYKKAKNRKTSLPVETDLTVNVTIRRTGRETVNT